jgi:hypothetical protein
MYLMAGPGTHQAVVVAALLAFDQRQERGDSHVARILDVVTRNVPAEIRAVALTPLIEALLDLTYLMSENGPVLRALGDILRRDSETRYALSLMRQRVLLVGEADEGPIARLLAEFEG